MFSNEKRGDFLIEMFVRIILLSAHRHKVGTANDKQMVRLHLDGEYGRTGADWEDMNISRVATVIVKGD